MPDRERIVTRDGGARMLALMRDMAILPGSPTGR